MQSVLFCESLPQWGSYHLQKAEIHMKDGLLILLKDGSVLTYIEAQYLILLCKSIYTGEVDERGKLYEKYYSKFLNFCRYF